MAKFPDLNSSASDTEIHLGDDEGVHFDLYFDSSPRFFAIWVLLSQTSATRLFQVPVS